MTCPRCHAPADIRTLRGGVAVAYPCQHWLTDRQARTATERTRNA